MDSIARRLASICSSGMRLKDLETGDTIGQDAFTRKIVAKLRGGDAKKSKAVLHEVNLGLLLGHPGKVSDVITKPMMELINQEIKQLTSLSHHNLVQLHNAFIGLFFKIFKKFQKISKISEKECLFFLVEYYEEGNLHKMIQMRATKMVPEPIAEPQALEWLGQLAKGLQYLHQRELIHCCISAKNVFFTSNQKIVKLGDCGITRVVDRTGQLGKRTIGNHNYMAPEVWDSKPYTKKSDIWSLGVLLYQLLSLKLPYEANNVVELFFKIKAGTRAQIPYVYSNETLHLVDRLLSMDAAGRPPIVEVAVDLEGAMTARPFQTVYWWNLKPPMRPSSSFVSSSSSKDSTGKKPWLKTPSKVVDLLNYRGEYEVVLVICKEGEILALNNQFDHAEAVVRWHGKVTVGRLVANGETNLAHASIYPSRGQIFFTINPPTEGIFMADIKEIANSKNPVELKRFDKGYASVIESDRLFNGLVIDIENQAVLCCDQSRKRTIGVWSVIDGRIHSEISLPGSGDNQFRPYKVCLHPVIIAGKRCQLLGVCDSPNSKIQLFITSKPKAGQAGLVESQFTRTLAIKGSLVGNVYMPQGVFFDPSGHLLVADAGNHRIQIFSADLPNEAVKGVLWDSFTTNTAGGFGEPVAVVSALDEVLARPIILAGLHDDKEVIIFK